MLKCHSFNLGVRFSQHQLLKRLSLPHCVYLPPFSGEGNGTPLQYSCLENPMAGGAWWATVHRVARSQTLLSNFTFTVPIYYYVFFKGTRTLFICMLCQIFIKYILHAGQFAGYKVGQDLYLFLKKQRVWQEGKSTCINSYKHRAVFFQGKPSTC